ncbi:endo-1,3-beta glucanase [Knufia fluminis]|uniref:glucan endo-1,3-beta-D-glucosidase n=1 Tax=Knufia fluminis TaxID=191047 RepID=A0AAN8I7U1_9EURO|nr:endo-1,3-beta glucanase [Knufia fluminis]
MSSHAGRQTPDCDHASQDDETLSYTSASESVVTIVESSSYSASPDSVITVVDRQAQTVTLTSIPSTQSPTDTSMESGANMTGSIITTLATEGNPPVQPFPTSLPSITESTLQPANATAVPLNGTTSAPPLSITATVTIPVSTFETVVSSETVASIPVPTVVNISSITVAPTTFTSDGTVIVTSSAQPTVIETTATVLSETTILANHTVTGTASTVVATGTLASIMPTSTDACRFTLGCESEDVFQPVAIGPPPASIPNVPGHPVSRLNINGMTGPIGTNKFYFNFFLGSQSFPAFVMPYSLSWSKGGGNAQSWGMAVSHIDDSQKVYGPNRADIPGNPASYYINPLGIQSIIFSAAELGTSTVLSTDSLGDMSGNANLSPNQGSTSYIKFPMVQGMAFVTGLYESLQPEIQTGVFFRSVVRVGQLKGNVYKYRLTLEDGKLWLLYASSSYGLNPNLKLVSSTMLQGLPRWSGLIQIAKLPPGADEQIFDNACGVYPSSGAVGGYATNSTAQYSLSWTKSGPYASNSTLLMYALPHHIQSFDQNTAGKVRQQVQLQTTTKGTATAVVSDYWILNEQLQPAMGFEPWRPDTEGVTSLPQRAIDLIQKVAPIEASQDMNAQTNLNSMYFSGKGLSKFAVIVYTMNNLAGQQGLAAAALEKLKAAFATFAENRQQFPLYYDTDWKGLVSSASYRTGDPGVDFGNSYYNDHHFHYGYFIHAAAVIGYLDPAWARANKDYVNALIRDVANPSTLDTYFPIFRSFDWYNGHSWAKGLFETGDGKDQESTSEDAMFAYGLKMWGRIIGDLSMERRGDLMLSVVSRAIQNYFLMDSDNKNQPARFIGNKATGILFENKADHVTYFGANLEYVQGIQMVPALPFSTLTRTKKFVQEEWELYFADGAVAQAQTVLGGWKGILFGNLAIINPQAAWNFFSQDNFDPSWIDGGASLTWYLAYTAGLGGVS